MRRYLWLISFCVLGLAGSTRAQSAQSTEHGKWELSFSGGGSFFGSKSFPIAVTGQPQRTLGLNFRTGYQVAARLGQNLGERWGAELEYGYAHNRMRLTNVQPNNALVQFGHTIHRFDYDVLFYPVDRTSRVRPFAFAGAGIAMFRTPNAGKETATAAGVTIQDRVKLSFNWGGGVKYLLQEQVALRAEFSDRISGVPNYGLVTGFSPEGTLHNKMLNLGVVFYWGSK